MDAKEVIGDRRGAEAEMIYITGDCHGDWRRFGAKIFPEQAEMTRDDYVIVCGDFGFWDRSPEQAWWLRWLSEKPFTLLWVDGNHENFDLLREIPPEDWHGGKVQRIGGNILRLMRGQVFELQGRSVFTFGGARSHDIADGILDPDAPEFRSRLRQLRRRRAMFRVNHRSWWAEELPSHGELEEGRRNLQAHGWQVDFIVTHCAPTSLQAVLVGGRYEPDVLTDYLEELRARCRYQKWFFGHYHDNRNVTERDILLYEQIIRVR